MRIKDRRGRTTAWKGSRVRFGRRRRRSALFLIACALVLGLTGLPRGSALAADAAALERSEPENGAELDLPPAAVRMWFAESVESEEVRIRVDGPDGPGEPQRMRAAPFEEGGRLAVVPLDSDSPGEYTVNWRLPDEGGAMAGEIRFTVQAAGDRSDLSGPSVPDVPGDQTTNPRVRDVTPAGAASSRDYGRVIGLAVLLGLVVTWAVRRLRKNGP